jgi:hypothetical protein
VTNRQKESQETERETMNILAERPSEQKETQRVRKEEGKT